LQKSEDGLLIVYTGAGKGKTTAALGLALRAVGHGRRVCLIQFLKGQATGEVAAAALLPEFAVVQAGRAGFVDLRAPAEEDRAAAREGLRRAEAALGAGDCGLVILDEINVAAAAGLIGVDEILDLVRKRPAGVDVVLTGRGAPAEFIAAADLVTEMREIKHPYRSGAPARPGIEY
jgi:cob(I)alamin adenosyltransferase